MIAAKLLVGIQADGQQSVDFVLVERFAALELAIDPGGAPPQFVGIHPLARISQGIITDGVLVTDPLLPLRQLGFRFQLQQTRNLSDLAQQQAQGDRTTRNLRVETGIGKRSGQQVQIEHLLGVVHEPGQFLKIGFTQRRAFPRAAAVQS